ncbi:MAG: shikimate dehydrogenase [Flavisolibacter sp.]|jgi:shikimate dehydrogenase|nr:shikimate dehydrogenase [Flavisolibacter sp.]
MSAFGLIGKSLKHSFSPGYFNEKFRKLGLVDHSYQAFELNAIDALPGFLKQHPELKGLNVTIPFKKEVLPFLDQQDELVSRSGACNCIKIADQTLTGFNTDIPGFRNALLPLLEPQHTKSLILGSGGASMAVRFVLESIGMDYLVVSRKEREGVINYQSLDETILNQHNLIINTTPLGMFPLVDAFPEIPYHLISKNHLLFDLIYNPRETEFLKKGAERGAKIENGFSMLINQAEESWKIWTH